MKVAEGQEIPGLERLNWTSTDVKNRELTVSEICERRFEDAYDDSWLSDVLRLVDATDVKSNYYDGGNFAREFDKYARANLLNDGWTHGWLQLIVQSMEDEVVERIRDDYEVVQVESKRNIEDHFESEYGFDGHVRKNIGDGVYLVTNPDLFGYDIVRQEFTVDHHVSDQVTFDDSPNYVIGWTRRAFELQGPAVLYDTVGKFAEENEEDEE